MTVTVVLVAVGIVVAIAVGVVIWRFVVRWPSGQPSEETWRHVPPYQGGGGLS